jgi:divalent metal cation (Fe/Co/Zn/Cd) transporter
VSLTIFWIGGVLAVIEGISHLPQPQSIDDPRLAFAALGVGAVFDGWSLRTTVRAGRPSKGGMTWNALIRSTKVPDLIVILLEDLGALIGIAIAAAGVGLTTLTGNGEWDALASVLIGLLLMAIGHVVNRETQSLLLGESATPDMETAIRGAIEATDGIAALSELRTIHLGPDDLVVAARILVDASSDGRRIDRSIASASERVRAAVNIENITVFLEPRARSAAPGGNDRDVPD